MSSAAAAGAAACSQHARGMQVGCAGGGRGCNGMQSAYTGGMQVRRAVSAAGEGDACRHAGGVQVRRFACGARRHAVGM